MGIPQIPRIRELMGISHYSLTPIQYTVLIDSEFGDI